MTLIEQLDAIMAGFQPLAKANHGQVRLCTHPGQAFEQIMQSPGALLVYVNWDGDNPWNDNSDVSRLKRRKFSVIISRGRNLALDPAAGITTPLGAQQALLSLLQQAQYVVTESLRFAPERGRGDPQNIPQGLAMNPWRFGNDMPLNVYEITFSICTP